MRPDWDGYFMALAIAAAARSTCTKKAVGCVLVSDRVVVSTGYNGSVRKEPHCSDDGCILDVNGDCMRTVHAEANAVAQAAARAGHVSGSVAYVTHRPCWECLKLLANAGVFRVVFGEECGDRWPVVPQAVEVVKFPYPVATYSVTVPIEQEEVDLVDEQFREQEDE